MSLVIRDLHVPSGWIGYSIHIASFPIEGTTIDHLRQIFDPMLQYLRTVPSFELSTWLLADSLHRDGATRQLGKHFREWMPDVGLGIWPQREAPRSFRDEDFLDTEYGSEMIDTVHQVIRVGPNSNAAQGAWMTMLGTGTTVLVFTEGPVDLLLAAARRQALTLIRDETFRTFPWYFPILDGQHLTGSASSTHLDEWLGPVQFYLRESEEDSAIILLVRESLANTLNPHISHLKLRRGDNEGQISHAVAK